MSSDVKSEEEAFSSAAASSCSDSEMLQSHEINIARTNEALKAGV